MMMSAVALRARLRKGELTMEAAIRQSLETIDNHDRDIRAFVALNAAARSPRPKRRSGPLSGIAIGVKDIIDTADMPTEMGSPIYAGWRPKADAALVMLARKAGASIIGKTATTAFAQGDPPATRNPHDHAHTPGGSSSGSAAAVAAGHGAARLRHADRRFGHPPGLLLRRRGHQAFLSAAADDGHQMLFDLARHRRPVRRDVADAAFALSASTGRDFSSVRKGTARRASP